MGRRTFVHWRNINLAYFQTDLPSHSTIEKAHFLTVLAAHRLQSKFIKNHIKNKLKMYYFNEIFTEKFNNDALSLIIQ